MSKGLGKVEKHILDVLREWETSIKVPKSIFMSMVARS